MTSLENGDVPRQNLGTPVSLFSIPGIRDSPRQNLFRRASLRRFPRRVRILFAYQAPAGLVRGYPLSTRMIVRTRSPPRSPFTRAISRFPPRRCDARAKRRPIRTSRWTVTRVCASLEIEPLVALTWVRTTLQLEHVVALTGCFVINSRESITYY